MELQCAYAPLSSYRILSCVIVVPLTSLAQVRSTAAIHALRISRQDALACAVSIQDEIALRLYRRSTAVQYSGDWTDRWHCSASRTSLSGERLTIKAKRTSWLVATDCSSDPRLDATADKDEKKNRAVEIEADLGSDQTSRSHDAAVSQNLSQLQTTISPIWSLTTGNLAYQRCN